MGYMKTKIIILFVFSIFVITEQGWAGVYVFESGQELKEGADAYERANNGVGTSADILKAMRFERHVLEVANVLGGEICVCEGDDTTQLFSIVSKFTRNNPEKWHLPATRIICDALWSTSYCK